MALHTACVYGIVAADNLHNRALIIACALKFVFYRNDSTTVIHELCSYVIHLADIRKTGVTLHSSFQFCDGIIIGSLILSFNLNLILGCVEIIHDLLKHLTVCAAHCMPECKCCFLSCTY